MSPITISCFKAYDIRGQLETELNEDVAYRVGRATGEFLNAKTVVVGGDVRETSEALKMALANGLMDAGVDVIDLGLTGTEEIYFATSFLNVDGGVEVTASHNPIDYNGMKIVREQSRPVGSDSGLNDIQKIAESGVFKAVTQKGSMTTKSLVDAYCDHLLSYIQPANFTRPLKLVINSGNGAAGHAVDAVESRFKALDLPVDIIKVHHEPDGTFPNGIPNPLLHDNRQGTIDVVLEHSADIGIAFDGDFDRCFLFDEKGQYIEGYYIIGLLAEAFLRKEKGAAIVYDPRLTWNTIETVKNAGGVPIQSMSGHSFMKQVMRSENAVYGGEMSAHHYFRDFNFCDSGMIPWLLVTELVSSGSATLSEMVFDMISAYPSPGEINSKLDDPKAAIERVLNTYKADALSIDYTDGISLEFAKWRFNLRSSNTEPVVRLNVESRGDISLMEDKTKEVLEILRQ